MLSAVFKLASKRKSVSTPTLIILVIIVFGVVFPTPIYAASLTMQTASLATGYSNPVDIENSGINGDDRLFIVERSGVIRIVKTDGTKIASPFLNITGLVTSGGEQGLLGLVFHPDYSSNRTFYVSYTIANGSLKIVKYTRDVSNADLADSSTAQTIITIAHPNYTNHNAGDMHFGPDGYLYISTGDGGSGGNPSNSAQDKTSLQGKILRINVDSGSPYSSPSSNPFYGAITGKDEVWAYGLRNPWKFSFDQATDDIWIADVGQGAHEEVNFQQNNSAGGKNYGWRCYEATFSYNTSGCGPLSSYVSPKGQYDHSASRCSVTGGYVYRGSQYPAMGGKYFFGDYCSGHLYLLKPNGSGGWTQELLTQLPINISTFGEDIDGEIYLADLSDGTIYHLTTTTTIKTGDFNSDTQVNIFDLSILLGSYNKSYVQSINPDSDLNNDGVINLSDLSLILSAYGT